MEKQTLSVDPAVVAQAKRYARRRQTSVSRLVETLLHLLARPAADTPADPPVLARLRGSLRRGSATDYRRHLERKYR